MNKFLPIIIIILCCFTSCLQELKKNKNEPTPNIPVPSADPNGYNNGNDNANVNQLIEGSLPGVFSVGLNKQIYFSKGNLQYQASTNTWRFAENQYDFVGDDVFGNVYNNGVKSNNSQVASYYTGWIDLFGWGTSGWNSGAVAYQPWTKSTNYEDYIIPGFDYKKDGIKALIGSFAYADWGMYNRISNGGDKTGVWRTLTSNEWQYLNEGRTNSNKLRGVATVNNVHGIIFLPDNYQATSVKFTPTETSLTTNNYSYAQWKTLENAGAVFLPAAGELASIADGNDWKYYPENVEYWCSNCYSEMICANFVGYFTKGDYYSTNGKFLIVDGFDANWAKLSVRLVHDK